MPRSLNRLRADHDHELRELRAQRAKVQALLRKVRLHVEGCAHCRGCMWIATMVQELR